MRLVKYMFIYVRFEMRNVLEYGETDSAGFCFVKREKKNAKYCYTNGGTWKPIC